jgi:hypothetical protein
MQFFEFEPAVSQFAGSDCVSQAMSRARTAMEHALTHVGFELEGTADRFVKMGGMGGRRTLRLCTQRASDYALLMDAELTLFWAGLRAEVNCWLAFRAFARPEILANQPDTDLIPVAVRRVTECGVMWQEHTVAEAQQAFQVAFQSAIGDAVNGPLMEKTRKFCADVLNMLEP